NAAVHRVICAELRLDLNVLVGIIREEISALALVGDDGTVFRSPVGVADGAEVAHAGGAIDERGPARVGPRHVRAAENAHDQQSHSDDRQAFHCGLLLELTTIATARRDYRRCSRRSRREGSCSTSPSSCRYLPTARACRAAARRGAGARPGTRGVPVA